MIRNQKFEFSQKDTTTKVYTVDKSMTNEKVEIHTTATTVTTMKHRTKGNEITIKR